jgi:hypothetical protein
MTILEVVSYQHYRTVVLALKFTLVYRNFDFFVCNKVSVIDSEHKRILLFSVCLSLRSSARGTEYRA